MGVSTYLCLEVVSKFLLFFLINKIFKITQIEIKSTEKVRVYIGTESHFFIVS